MTKEERRARRERYGSAARAANTRKAYRYGWRMWCEWCAAEGLEPLNAEAVDVADWLCELADSGLAAETIKQRRYAVSHYYRRAGQPDLTKHEEVAQVSAGIRREISETRGQAEPFRADDVTAMHAHLRATGGKGRVKVAALIGVMRDAMLRVSEASAMDWEHVRWPAYSDEPGELFIPKSKTDQYGAGFWRSLSPNTMMYLGMLGNPDMTGPVFRGVRGRHKTEWLVKLIQKTAKDAGLEGRYSGHSFRIGMAIDLYVVHRMDLPKIMTAGRWSSMKMVLHYLKPYLVKEDPVRETFTGGPSDR